MKSDDELREEIRSHIKRYGHGRMKYIVEEIDPYAVFDAANVTYSLRFALHQLEKAEERHMDKALNVIGGKV